LDRVLEVQPSLVSNTAVKSMEANSLSSLHDVELNHSQRIVNMHGDEVFSGTSLTTAV
jgi:hypothetical protein